MLSCSGQRVPNEVVIVSRLSADPTDFQTSAWRTTDAHGRYALFDRPAASADYVATWQGNTSCGRGAQSPVAHAAVRPGIILNADETSIRSGMPAALAGRILPAHPGASVGLQVLQGSSGRWADGGWTHLDAEGRYRFGYRKTGGPGYLVMRVAFPTQDGDHAWNVSRPIRVDWT